MANVYVTGPAHIYVAVNNNSSSSGMSDLLLYPAASAIRYLGSTEGDLRILVRPQFKPVFADVGGDMTPFDDLFMGETAQIVGVLNVWNESVYARCTRRPFAISGTRGTYAASAIGSLMLASASAYHVWVRFPYKAKQYGTGYSGGDGYNMPGGYHFFAGWMNGPDEIVPGSKASKRVFSFQTRPVYKPTDGTWVLYDHEMTNIPAIPPATLTGELS